MKRMGLVFLAVAAGVLLVCSICAAETETPADNVERLEDVEVKEKAGAPGLTTSPDKTVIELDEYATMAPPGSIVDVLKTHAIVDFRGDSDFDPGIDSVYVRGFDATRFVTAIDDLTLLKTGGRKSSNIVDYATLPAFLIDKVEVLPGPHSARFDSKAIGGVLNFVTRQPKRQESAKPNLKFSTSYGSYDSWNNNVSMNGAISAFVYDFGYQYTHTDGYLRNSETENQTVFGRIGFVLPGDGFLAFSTSYADTNREAPVRNPAKDGSDYDSDYPKTDSGAFDPYAKPTWDSLSTAYRLNYEQSLPIIGRLKIGAYKTHDFRDRSYYASETDTTRSEMETDWWAQGGKIQDDIRWSANHQTTLGFDIARLYDDGIDDHKGERTKKRGTFIEHKWGILPSVDIRAGLRYEDVRIWVTNFGAIPNREDVINRRWNELIPKSFTTWRMDGVAPWLRDTALSLGVSKIWRAPDYHGDYNPQGRPAGAWLEDEHGIGYDLVLDRRLWRDISFQINYAFYDIKDFIASNSAYAQYTGPGNGNLRYSDYKINLDRVHRHGVDVTLGGHLTDDLSFRLTYAWQHFSNRGDERAGETALHQRAENRITASLRYDLFERTTLMLDYYYQDKEITEEYVELVGGDWYFNEKENPSYSVFDFGVQQQLFKQIGFFENGTVKAWVKNLFDEEYNNSSGYPGTDRTFGVSFQFGI